MVSEPGRSVLASASPARHLGRGALGFGLLASAFALIPSLGLAALVAAPLGLLALRGCPTCWAIGLLETISAGRLERRCGEGGCELQATLVAGSEPSLRAGPAPR
jgi:hypothetical protein